MIYEKPKIKKGDIIICSENYIPCIVINYDVGNENQTLIAKVLYKNNMKCLEYDRKLNKWFPMFASYEEILHFKF